MSFSDLGIGLLALLLTGFSLAAARLVRFLLRRRGAYRAQRPVQRVF
ncbi:MAG TPA: hypothetical protein VG870_12355 [Chitinophagaceae bacterium]|nr:hypothetical protein [Chitinophagaceae bacterium]